MAAAGTAGECYRVGDLVIDVGLQRVTGPAGEHALPRLSFDLLLALVRRAPEFVSNDELAAIVWAGVVVSPETVTKRVNLLREAIGDDAAHPRYIAGLRARGYRITAPVERAPADRAPTASLPGTAQVPAAVPEATVPAANDTAAVAPASPHGWRWAAALALVGVAVIGAWAVRGRTIAPVPSAEQASLPTAADRSVAVLRFNNLSPDPGDAYLAAGVPEMILDRLATVPGLTVIASGSALAIESGATSPQEVRRQLGARYLVEGSTQRDDESLRVTVRLIDAATGVQVWATHEDRPLVDLFVLQDVVASSVASELAHRLQGLSDLRPMAPSTPVVQAQLAFLQGRAMLSRGTIASARQAIGMFERAVELDPRFAAAYAELYDAHMFLAERSHEDVEAVAARHAPLIDRALGLDPQCGSAYLARAIWSDRDDASREADFKRGIELDPSNSRGLVAYAIFMREALRDAEAKRMLDRALQVDPMAPRVHFALVQQKFRAEGGLALEQGMRRVLDVDPNYQPALQRYTKYRWMHHGKLAEAAQIMDHSIAVDPENPWSRNTAAAIQLDLGDADTARRIAAATPSSRATAEILLALHAGDWHRAGELALGPPGRRYNRFESWGVPEAVRDWSLRTGDFARGIAFFEERYGLIDNSKLDLSNFRAASCLASLLLQSGQQERAQRLLRALPGAIEPTIERDGPVYALRTMATVRMLQGDSKGALAMLADSFHADDFTMWWYTLERDPVWDSVRESGEFQSIAREVHARIASEQAAYAASKQSPFVAPTTARATGAGAR